MEIKIHNPGDEAIAEVISNKIELSEVQDAVENYDSINEAIFVQKPYATVIATMFEEQTTFVNYFFRIFYTKEAALDWLI